VSQEQLYHHGAIAGNRTEILQYEEGKPTTHVRDFAGLKQSFRRAISTPELD
jgi:hypothetical protein